MDKKQEELLKEKERLQGYVNRAEKYERLLKSEDFTDYLKDLSAKVDRYVLILTRPPKVGQIIYNNETITETGTGYSKTYQRKVPVSVTIDDVQKHIEEFNVRIDELKLVIDLSVDIVRDAKSAQERITEIDKILGGSNA